MKRLRFVPLLLAGFWTTHAQTPGPAFDVASIKADDNAMHATVLTRSGGRIEWTTTRMGLVSRAFDMPRFLISGLDESPPWIVLRAETDPAATEEQVRLMLQRLLTERFQLAVHRETKDRPVFSLVRVSKGGPNLKVVKPEEKVSPMPAYYPKKGPSSEGRIVFYVSGSRSALVGRRVTMQQVAEYLTHKVATTVTDKTGMAGTFDLELTYVEDSPGVGNNEASFFGALQEQLGLKLEKRIAPVELLVVDHMEKRPTAN